MGQHACSEYVRMHGKQKDCNFTIPGGLRAAGSTTNVMTSLSQQTDQLAHGCFVAEGSVCQSLLMPTASLLMHSFPQPVRAHRNSRSRGCFVEQPMCTTTAAGFSKYKLNHMPGAKQLKTCRYCEHLSDPAPGCGDPEPCWQVLSAMTGPNTTTLNAFTASRQHKVTAGRLWHCSHSPCS